MLEGEIGVMIGDEVFTATKGSYVLKPRGIPHTFWNPGPEPARVVEIFSPAGFERYFEELAEILSADGPPRRARRQVRPDLPLGADRGDRAATRTEAAVSHRFA